jgi:ribosomal protein S14
MSARNPGPILHHTPLGFQSFQRHSVKDYAVRRAFAESEVNTRVYKAVFETFGVKGRIQVNKEVGRSRIRLRCIHGSRSAGFSRWMQMSRHGFHQSYREGWLLKYGLDPNRMH